MRETHPECTNKREVASSYDIRMSRLVPEMGQVAKKVRYNHLCEGVCRGDVAGLVGLKLFFAKKCSDLFDRTVVAPGVTPLTLTLSEAAIAITLHVGWEQQYRFVGQFCLTNNKSGPNVAFQGFIRMGFLGDAISDQSVGVMGASAFDLSGLRMRSLHVEFVQSSKWAAQPGNFLDPVGVGAFANYTVEEALHHVVDRLRSMHTDTDRRTHASIDFVQLCHTQPLRLADDHPHDRTICGISDEWGPVRIHPEGHVDPAVPSDGPHLGDRPLGAGGGHGSDSDSDFACLPPPAAPDLSVRHPHRHAFRQLVDDVEPVPLLDDAEPAASDSDAAYNPSTDGSSPDSSFGSGGASNASDDPMVEQQLELGPSAMETQPELGQPVVVHPPLADDGNVADFDVDVVATRVGLEACGNDVFGVRGEDGVLHPLGRLLIISTRSTTGHGHVCRFSVKVGCLIVSHAGPVPRRGKYCFCLVLVLALHSQVLTGDAE